MGQCHSGNTTDSNNTLTELPSLNTPHTQLLETGDMAEDYSDDFDEEEEEEEEANESSSENDEPSIGMEGLPPYTYQENDSVRLWELEICRPQSNLKLTSSLQEHFL